MTRTSIYVRVDFDRHRRLTTYARENGLTVNDICVMLFDQLLAQVSAGYVWPEWLRDAVAAGHLQHLRDYAEEDVLPTEPCATRTRGLRVV